MEPDVRERLALVGLVGRMLGQSAPCPVVGDRYEIRSQLGIGGMGTVFAALDRELRREVALKVIRVGRTPEGKDVAEARLLREARGLARLSHPNVVPVFDVGSSGECVFFVMQYIRGCNLRDRVDSRRQVRRLLMQAGRGLAAAHAAGVVHRDVKPSNVMVREDGTAQLVDFGLARWAGGGPTRAEVEDVGLEVELSRDGLMFGSPGYIAPELRDASSATKASDQFAFCMTARECLWGLRPPAQAELFAGRAVEGPDGRTDRALWAVLARGLLPDPSQRWPSMDELLAALAAAQPSRVGAATIVAFVFVAAAAALTGAEWTASPTASSVAVAGAQMQASGTMDAAVARAAELSELQLRTGTWRRAERWVRHGEAIAERGSVSAGPRARLRRSAAGIAAHRRDYVGALAIAASALEELGERSPPERVRLMNFVGVVELARGRHEAAREVLSVAQREAATSVGADDSLFADLKNNQASVFLAEGDLAEADRLYRAALELRLARLGGAHRLVADSHVNLSQVAFARTEYDEAERLLKTALVIYEVLPEPAHAAIADVYNNLANIAYMRDDNEAAAGLHRRALDLRISARGEGDEDVATTLSNLGAVNNALGRFPQARAALERALSIYERIHARNPHPDIARTLHNLAEASAGLGDRDEAVRLAEGALQMRSALTDPVDIAASRWLLARLLVDNQPPRATTLATLARAALAEADSEEDVDRIDSWLAMNRSKPPRDPSFDGPH